EQRAPRVVCSVFGLAYRVRKCARKSATRSWLRGLTKVSRCRDRGGCCVDIPDSFCSISACHDYQRVYGIVDITDGWRHDDAIRVIHRYGMSGVLEGWGGDVSQIRTIATGERGAEIREISMGERRVFFAERCNSI